MNEWMFVAIYFGAGYAAITIFMVGWCGREFFGKDLDINDGAQALFTGLSMFIWPISITVCTILAIRKSRNDRIIGHCNYIKSKHNMERISPHDRSGMIDVPDKELKFLLDGHRRGYISLGKPMLEMVRDELMHRDTEKQLLK
jgi:hypothetical protein